MTERLAGPTYRQVGWMTRKGLQTAHAMSDHDIDALDERTLCSDDECVPLFVAEAVGVIEPADPTDDNDTDWPSLAGMLRRGDPDELAAHLHKLDPELHPAPIDSATTGGMGAYAPDTVWPESTS